ncbi:tRNA pseudouridine(13) synthase TruD [Hydrocarboniclastica marina]|uniref:tRNA pseudouridine synthase D n=1 Tax=Hydrocarboniclastica marina TaxID=2259620 RepID=A0A4P7XI33_9ALTE|nr:tRNA pseudouridine(13) synthase TruD [Hydrocarboniclastica marina]QCF26375.1 tRNA pseudouridine(13) synthase TruD [Hydrocarboniclastica marina]
MNQWRLSWPFAWGGPVATGRFKTVPEDFEVEEILTEPFSGEGEHLCLWLEKRGDNTDFIGRQLARCLGVEHMAVSFCGLKDRHAVTRQWFSIQLPGIADDTALEKLGAEFRILSHTRNRSKLRRGQHWGNRFVIRLREVQGDRPALETRLNILAEKGGPNYFGPQRFGHGGGNLREAEALDPRKLRGRNVRTGLYLSAARSWLFNEVLAARVEAGTWLNRIEGDPILERPTGPMLGDGGGGASGPLAETENSMLAAYPAFDRLFRARRLAPERRDLCVVPRDFDMRWEGDDLILAFSLSAGSYATSWLGEAVTLISAEPEKAPGQ